METPPLPPVKESALNQSATAALTNINRGPDGGRVGEGSGPQPIGALGEPGAILGGGGDGRAGQGGQQPAQQQLPQKPMFEVSVGDPHKVGDLTSAHTVYQVRTKVIEVPRDMKNLLLRIVDNI